MQGLVALALLLVPLVNARPQYPGTVICDQTPVTAFTYENQGHKEVTEDTGDKGWVNYDAQTCTAYGQCKYNLYRAAPHPCNTNIEADTSLPAQLVIAQKRPR